MAHFFTVDEHHKAPGPQGDARRVYVAFAMIALNSAESSELAACHPAETHWRKEKVTIHLLAAIYPHLAQD